MASRLKRFLIVDSNAENRSQMAHVVRSAFVAEVYDVIESSSSKEAVDQLDKDEAGVIIVGDVGEDESVLETIKDFHLKSPAALIYAIVERADKTVLDALLRAGARECLMRQRALEPMMISVLRDSIEQVPAENVILEDQEFHSNEIQPLHALYDPAHLYQTARHYGRSALSDSNPQQFRSLLVSYDRLLDLSIEQQCVKTYGDLDPELNRFIIHLGALNAGPRDVIDIHKAALSAKLLRLTPRKRTPLLEESRLLILKVMGELARYYWTLSCGETCAFRKSMLEQVVK